MDTTHHTQTKHSQLASIHAQQTHTAKSLSFSFSFHLLLLCCIARALLPRGSSWHCECQPSQYSLISHPRVKGESAIVVRRHRKGEALHAQICLGLASLGELVLVSSCNLPKHCNFPLTGLLYSSSVLCQVSAPSIQTFSCIPVFV